MTREPPSIDGLQVPAQLWRLMRTGRWTRPDDVDRLRHATGIPDAAKLVFLAIDEMRSQHSSDLEAIRAGDGPALGLYSSALGERGEEGLLDVDRGMVIAAAIGDSGLALDYRRGGEPRVVATRWGSPGCRWEEVAPTFDDFLVRVGLSVTG